ncbi:neurocan core protein-like isoform X2 [Mytilus galloprovincialis]|uniref:neurocan core protein-like isoform X2 n=1 Tax=Mytilus galloprovincialis TaxID=29158 RepID=UPI003F7C3D60
MVGHTFGRRSDYSHVLCHKCCNNSDICNAHLSCSDVVHGQLNCLSCHGIADPHLCVNVITCRQDEICYVNKYQTHSGHQLYDVGCKRSNLCAHINTFGLRTSTGVHQQCEACCSVSSLCNHDLKCDVHNHIDSCTSNPCQHDGQCSNQIDGYSCTCNSGYSGLVCQTDINECTSNPCQNGGTCIDHANEYRCSCVPGYGGINCQTVPHCPNGWMLYNHHCYFFGREKISWDQAAYSCGMRGGYLTKVDDRNEDIWLQTHMLGWIGATDRGHEGQWVWYNDGTPVQYNSWRHSTGEPNNANGGEDCAYMLDGGIWNDASCDSPISYICEKNLVANG